MKKKRKVLGTLFTIGCAFIYLLGIAILCWQALTPGNESSNISNSVGDKIDDVVTQIQKPTAETVPVTGVEITSIVVDGDNITLQTAVISKGSVGKIVAKVKPDNASNKALLYASSNSAVITANEDGTITAKEVGSATITVKSKEKETILDTCVVEVREVALESFVFHSAPTSVYVGDSRRLTLDYTPSNTSQKSVTWTSSNTNVLSVSNGVVRGVSEGIATITATSKTNPSVFATTTIEVKTKPVQPVIDLTGIALQSTSTVYRIGDTTTITASYTPNNATYKTLVWHSSDEEIATVSQSGKVTFLKAGTVLITADSSTYQTISDGITFTVKEVLSETITLNLQALTKNGDGYTMKMATSATVSATLDEKATILQVVWTSSNPEIVKINPDGTIEALKGGTVTITASTSYDGESTEESFSLTVEEPTFKDTVKNFYYWVRKSFGHFGAFLVLGIFAVLTYARLFPKSTKGRIFGFVVCIVAGFGVAGLTEILQLPYFTTGRYCSFDDVLLDFKGYCTAALPMYFVIFAFHFIRLAIRKKKGLVEAVAVDTQPTPPSNDGEPITTEEIVESTMDESVETVEVVETTEETIEETVEEEIEETVEETVEEEIEEIEEVIEEEIVEEEIVEEEIVEEEIVEEETVEEVVESEPYADGVDPFLASLTDEEKAQFVDIFILKRMGTMPEIPSYQLCGNNKKFFREFFVHLGQYRGIVPTKLLEKMYQFVKNNY